MVTLKTIALILVGAVASFFGANTLNLGNGSGTINQLDQWKATSTPFSAITTNTHGKDVYIPFSDATTSSLALKGILNCNGGSTLDTDSNGNIVCGTDDNSGGGGSYPFTPTTNYGVNNQATTGIAWFQNGLNASSTSHFVYASTTALSGDALCVGTDCRTSWPTGSGSGNVSTSSSETQYRVAYWDSTNATPALLGNDSTFTFTPSTGVLNAGRLRSTALTSVALISTQSAFSIKAGANISGSGAGSVMSITGGDATVVDENGGDVWIQQGAGSGSGTNGVIYLVQPSSSNKLGLNINNISGTITQTFQNTNGTIALTSQIPSIDWRKEENFGALALTPTTTIPIWAKDWIYASSSLRVAGNITATNITATGTVTTVNLLATGSSTLQDFTGINSTTTNSTSTTFFATTLRGTNLNAVGATTTDLFVSSNASTTRFFGSNINTCTSGNFLTWSGGLFGCSADQVGAGGSYPFTPSVNYNLTTSATTAPMWFQNQVFASSSLIVAGDVRASTFTATTTTATSTFAGGFSITGYGVRLNNFVCNGFANGGVLTTDANGDLKCTDDDSGAGGGAFAWTPTTNFGQNANSTTTQIWLKGSPYSLTASSTSVFDYASSSALTVTGQVDFDTLTSALVLAGSGGVLGEYTGSSCTNQFPRSTDASGAWTCATVGTADVAGLDISADTNLAVTFPVVLTDDTLSFGGLSTSTAVTSSDFGKLPYFSGVNTFAHVATGTISVPTGLTVTANRSCVGGACAIALDTGYVIPLQTTLDAKALGATTITVAGTANQITSSAGAQDLSANRTWTLSIPSQFNIQQSSTTQVSVVQKLYVGGTATTTINSTGDLFVIGSTTLQNFTGLLATTTNATSTNFFATNLRGDNIFLTGASTGCATFTSGALSSTGVACGSGGGDFPFTTTPNYNSTSTVIAFHAGLFSTASSTFNNDLFLTNLSQGSLYTGTNGIVKTIATSTPTVTAPITYSGTLGSFIGGSTGSFGCTNASSGVTGCLTGTDWNTFNSKLSSYDAFTHPLASNPNSATTSIMLLYGNASTTQLSVFNVAGFGATATSTFNSTGDLFVVGSTTLQNFTGRNATTTNATTTNLYVSGTASTTRLFGANLAPCSGGNFLTWSGGLFGCSPDTGGSVAFDDLTDVTLTSVASGDMLYYNGSAWVNLPKGSNGETLLLSGGLPSWGTPSGSSKWTDVGIYTYLTSITDDLAIGNNIATSAPFWFDVSATTSYIGNGGTGDSVVQFGTSTMAWTIGIDDSDGDSFKIASSSTLGTEDYLTITKVGRFGIGTTSPLARLTVSATSSLSNYDLLRIEAVPSAGATTTAMLINSSGGALFMGSTTLQNFTGLLATTTHATSTSLFSTTLRSSTLYSPETSVATTLVIPAGTACDSNVDGEICQDTSDNQLIVDGSVVQTQGIKIWGATIASTSPVFINGGLMPVPTQLDGYTITRIQCHVTTGTSKVIAVEDASANSSEDITCATTNTTDDGSITNATYTASELSYIDFGATTGSVDFVTISVFGTWTRD